MLFMVQVIQATIMCHVTAKCRIAVTKETEQQIHFTPDNDSISQAMNV